MDFLLADFPGKPLWSWVGFIVLVLALLIFDLGVLQRKPDEIKVRESLMLSAFYISIGTLCSLWVWYFLVQAASSQYLTGGVVEKSLAAENIFVIAMIFFGGIVVSLWRTRTSFDGCVPAAIAQVKPE